MAGRCIRALVTLSMLALISGPVMAQQATDSQAVSVPRLITFNGTLRDQTGQPLSGVVGIQFALYKDQEGGAPLWTEVQNAQLDPQGRYAVLLGSTQAGLPLDLFSSNESRWLAIRADIPGAVEQPRVLLVSVPYALKAADADTIGGRPASAFVLAETFSDVKRSTSTSMSTSTSSDTTAALTAGNTPVPFNATGTGTQNKVAKWTDNAGTLGDSIITDNGTNVGVNNTAPVVGLDVAGTIRSVFSANAPYGTYLMPTGGAANSFRFGFGNNLYFDGTNWRTKGDGANNAGSALLTDIGVGAMSIFALPPTGGTDQVVSNANFGTYEKMQFRVMVKWASAIAVLRHYSTSPARSVPCSARTHPTALI